jgi:predicted nucleic acid-binding Zn ribbon protein
MFKRTGHISRFGDALESTLREHELKEPLRPRKAAAIWAEVVGPEIAAASFAEGVRGGVLFVRVRSNVWSNELTFYKQDIITRLNRRVGGDVISDIHFKTSGPVRAAEKAQPDVTKGPDEDDLKRVQPHGPLADAARRRTAIPDPEFDRHLRATTSRAARTSEWKREHGWVTCSVCESLFEPRKEREDNGVCLYCETMKRVQF